MRSNGRLLVRALARIASGVGESQTQTQTQTQKQKVLRWSWLTQK